MTDYAWLALADKLRKQLEDWDRQDAELDDARAGLDPRDRDADRELEENRRIMQRRDNLIWGMIQTQIIEDATKQL